MIRSVIMSCVIAIVFFGASAPCSFRDSADTFSNAGYTVDAYALPGIGHTINADGVALGQEALEHALGALSRGRHDPD